MVHTLRLDNYYPTPQKLVLGTNSSFGTESIKIERGAGWDGLNLTATWHIPGREEPLRVALLDGDAMDVPPEVTKEAKDGVLVLAGLASGVQRASCNVEYLILEQAGVYGGADAEPTPELAAQVIEAALQAKADAEAVAEDAAAAKANADKAKADAEKAQQAAENAAADAAKAGPYAEAARAAQEAAESARDEAIAAQQAAENAAAAAAASKSAADTLAAEAARAALAAENSKTAANNAAYFAGENATAAQQAAATATAAANDAGQSASDAAASKAAAETAAKAAKDAQTAAAAAKAAAVKAQGAAETAAKSAQDAQAAAEKARDEAKAAQKGAEAARDAAAKSAEAAAKSEANAKQSADTVAESVKNITPDDSSIGDKPWSSKHIIDMLCPPLEESGNPVVCYPVAGYPLGVKAKWEPVQEGSGTPYPAGGGKNLFNPAWMPEKEVNTGVTWTITPDGTVTANGTTDSTAYYNSEYFSLPAGKYTISAMPRFRISITNTDAGNTLVASQFVGKPCTFTVENDIQKATLFFATTGTLDNVSAKPQIEKGTTATAWAPYENIRPIKGRDSVTVERCGENILNTKAYTSTTTNGITFTVNEDKSVRIVGTATGRAFFKLYNYQDKMSLPDGKYTFSTIANIPSGVDILIGCYYKGELPAVYKKNLIVLSSGKSSSTNSLSGVEWLDGYIEVLHGSTVDTTLYPMLVPGTTAPTTYTPYTGQTNTLTLPKTVYGGEVDAVTGEGQETWKMLTLDGTEEWNVDVFGSAIYVFLKDRRYILADVSVPAYSNQYPFRKKQNLPTTYMTASDSNYLEFGPVESVSTWKDHLAAQKAKGTPVQVAINQTTAVPFTATGAQALPALAGVNTVLTDADSTTVTGRADPIKRITDLEDAVASQT